MTALRIALGLGGGVLFVVGGLALRDEGLDNLVAASWWLVGGVLLHDGVLAPATVIAGLLLTRLAPTTWRGPVIAAAIVLGSVTLLAVPVLGRFGARADNPTLLDRDYLTNWLLFAGLVLLVTASWVAAGAVRRQRGSSG